MNNFIHDPGRSAARDQFCPEGAEELTYFYQTLNSNYSFILSPASSFALRGPPGGPEPPRARGRPGGPKNKILNLGPGPGHSRTWGYRGPAPGGYILSKGIYR